MELHATITKLDQEERLAMGYASTEALDCQGEIIKREALQAALPDYMKFANVREMHGPSAVGVIHKAELDDKGLYLACKVVDPLAWEKVRQGVYKGFSIGGRVTARDPQNPHIITGLDLNEISLVDRPANPEAMIDAWKALELAKEGRRNSEADQEKLDAAHDAIVAAGAHCGAEKLQSHIDLAKLSAEASTLRKLLGELTIENATLKGELETYRRMPAPAKGTLRAIGKGEDIGFAAETTTTELPARPHWFRAC